MASRDRLGEAMLDIVLEFYGACGCDYGCDYGQGVCGDVQTCAAKLACCWSDAEGAAGRESGRLRVREAQGRKVSGAAGFDRGARRRQPDRETVHTAAHGCTRLHAAARGRRRQADLGRPAGDDLAAPSGLDVPSLPSSASSSTLSKLPPSSCLPRLACRPHAPAALAAHSITRNSQSSWKTRILIHRATLDVSHLARLRLEAVNVA